MLTDLLRGHQVLLNKNILYLLKQNTNKMKTNADLLNLVQALNANVGESKTKGQKKLVKIGERIQKYLDDFNEKKEELRLDAASVDKDGNLITNEKGEYSFNKEGVKKLNKQLKDLLLTNIDFAPIPVINPEGLEMYVFLDGWVNGVEFKKLDEIEL
jgi:hypothetical protein